MKFHLILLLFTFSNQVLLHSSTNPEQTIHFEISVKNLVIEGYDGTEILVEEDGTYIRILDNDCTKKMIVKSDEEGIFIKSNLSCLEELKFKIPQKRNLFVVGSALQKQTINVFNYEGKVEMEGLGDQFKLIEVTGPLLVGSLNSQILVVFSEFHQAELSEIISMEGDIKVYVPDSMNANLLVTGRKIKTDLDIPLGQGKKRRRTKTFAAALNGGGQKLELVCPAGSVAIFKK